MAVAVHRLLHTRLGLVLPRPALRGTVSGGRLSGARVHGRANTIGQTACGGLVLAGRFRVMPASAG